MSGMKKQVCVVGAGASGLVTIKELLDEGHEVTCFEKYDNHGGVFYRTDSFPKPGAYDSTKLTISNYMMAFSSLPPPEHQERRFWSAREYQEYLQEFVKRFSLDACIQYKTEVLGVRKASDGRYDVEVRSTDDGAKASGKRFDAVAISTGTHRIPRHIEVEGIKNFTGEINHSAFYKNATPYRGKRVLCVGMGETAADVVNEIAQVAQTCTLSVRRHQPVVERFPMGKEHTNDAYTSHLLYSMPVKTRNALMRFQFGMMKKYAKTETARALAEWNLKADNYYNHFFTKNEAFIERIVDRSLSVNASGIERLGEDYVVFKDGHREPIDMIMLNTGYIEQFSMIRDLEVRDVRQMYKHMIHPDLGDGIVLIGWARPAVGGIPACSEMQARYFALLCSGKKTLPSRAELESKITQQAKYEDDVYFGNAELRTLVHYTGYMSDFAEVIGCSPWRPSAFLNPFLIYRLWCGSQMPYIYRLFGEHSDFEQAKKAIFNVPTAFNLVDLVVTAGIRGVSRALEAFGVTEPDPVY